MARRKSRKSNRRRSTGKSGINVVNAAELYLTTSIMTQSLFAVDPITFVTGKTSNSLTQRQGNLTSTYNLMGYAPQLDGTKITLPELLGRDSDGLSGVYSKATVPFGGLGGPLGAQIKTNVAAYGGLSSVLINTVLVKGGFTVGKRLLSKQRTVLRKGLKMAGLKGTVTV